ncbi:tumor necrosis factor receptor superfamily member 5-like [Scyliorhinus torazame]
MKVLLYLWLFTQVCHCESATKCNTITQYIKFSRCCAKCPPGSYMNSECTVQSGTDCKPCEEGRYQSNWNLADHCQQHMYCDPNGGFVTESPGNTLHDTVCVCEIGEHCINSDCEMCVKDTPCEPGSGVGIPADRKHKDTMCKECESGYYSNVSSSVEYCQKWTNCGPQEELKPGSSTTDVKCKTGPGSVPNETPTIVISVLVTATLVALAAALIYHRDYLKEMLGRLHKQLKQPEQLAPAKDTGGAVILPEDNWHFGQQASDETSVPIPESLAEEHRLIPAHQEDGKEYHLPEQEQEQTPLPKT